MANINQHTREVSAKIVYYGPAGSGKTTCLEFIHGKLREDLRGRLMRVPTQIDPTVAYELLPVELGEIKGMTTKFEVASVPGDPIHRATRKTLLRDVDGIVFVGDARPDRLDSNVESLKDLEENLAAYGRSLADVPLIFQWNHSDAPESLAKDELDRRLNEGEESSFPTIAPEGRGVLEALTTIAKLILRRLRTSATRAGAPGESAAQQAAGEASSSVRVRVAEPPSLEGAGESAGETFDPRPLAAEAEAEASDQLAEPETLELGEPIVPEDSGVGDGADAPDAIRDEMLPEALVEELGEEMPDLDLPMEPLQDDAGPDTSIDALESGFRPIDFTTEVTDLAERGHLDDEWEIVAVGAPTRLGPASFTIPLEIREGDHPAREVEITITLSGMTTKRK